MKKWGLAFQRFVLKLLCIFLGLVLAVLVVVTLSVQYLMDRIQYVEPQDHVSLSQQELEEYLEEERENQNSGMPTMDPETVDFGRTDIPIGGEDSRIINILLIGQDRRPGESRSRSDSMILCTFNRQTKQLILTSILRDLYVQIPGYGENRINVAYAAGGMGLLNRTLEQNLGIQVDGTVEVDFAQFRTVVDRLGGVTVELRQDEAELMNLSPGRNLLSGEQALQYARIRSLDKDGDFSRTNRQRKVMEAVVEAYRNANLKTVLSLVDELLPMITTDMDNLKIITYAVELFPMLSEVELVSQRVPADGTYSARMIRGMAVLVADLDAARQLLLDTLIKQES